MHHFGERAVAVAGRLSAQHGWWDERWSDERSYVAALKHLAEADVRAARAILAARGDAVIVQSESSECYGPASPDALAATYRYLAENGMMEANSCAKPWNLRRHRANPLGLHDLDRRVRPVGEACRDGIAQWRPMQDKLAMSQLPLW